MKPRDYFIHRIQGNLIGPGADNFGMPAEEELLTNMPLQTYYSAILFPEVAAITTVGENAAFAEKNTFLESESTLLDTNEEHLTDLSDKTTIQTFGKEGNSEKSYVDANNYFPNNFGLTFCVDADTSVVKVQFDAAHYQCTKSFKERKVKVSENSFYQLKNDVNFPYAEHLEYENGFMFLNKELKDARRVIKSYNEKTEFRNSSIIKKLELFAYNQALFKRKSLTNVLEINIKNNQKIYDVFCIGDVVVAKAFVKIIRQNDRCFVKVLLKNTFAPHHKSKFSNGNELLNEKCFFQVAIKVVTDLKSYKSNIQENDYDEEATLINYQYRTLLHYGIGHGCAVTWEQTSNPTWISTTYLPEVNIKSVSQDFRNGQEYLRDIAMLKNISIWTNLSQSTICDKLKAFADAYANWISEQESQSKQEPNFQSIANKIIGKQQYNRDRLYANIELLRSNKAVFDCFLLANTAMYIQMIISRDERFGRKEKHLKDFGLEDIYDDLAFFENYNETKIAYRPFQLAFFVLNLEGIVDEKHTDRNEKVDLLWFPTGGGKTEAYLAITAFTIFWRRLRFPYDTEGGVSVIMRYTLRLLTAQQFERASRLICAMEFLRKKRQDIGNEEITIGMWVGTATTPNDFEKANEKVKKLQEALYTANNNNKNSEEIQEAEEKNVFQISACPFCGCKLISKNTVKNEFVTGFSATDKSFSISCLNKKCSFSKELPLQVIDAALYKKPPTLLFATVDKFAQLSHVEDGHKFFNSLSERGLPPDLIIQDELHLLNGPLGSIVGLFELMVEMLCSREGRKPKIIASTATTRNTDEQIRNLYGNRTVNIFPAQGINYNDSYFSLVVEESKRKYIGFMPTGKTSVDTQTRGVLPALFFARLELYKNDKESFKKYWTIVSYYNSLKDVGKIYNKVGDEITVEIRKQQRIWDNDNHLFDFNYKNLINRTTELTSRIESSKIKNTLKDLEVDPIIEDKKTEEGRDYKGINNVCDLVLASNMFSVGIDIERLNVMLMNGQPKNIAEYIQASSRVARKDEGVVINLLDANRAREKSYFEHYIPFHEAYYKYVEPLTVTPFTETTFERVLNTILVCFVRHIQKLHENKQAHEYRGDLEKLKEAIQSRIPKDEPTLLQQAYHILDKLSEDWLQKIKDKERDKAKLSYKQGLISKAESQDDWSLMNSMREVDTTTIIKIKIFEDKNEKDNTETK